MRVWGWGGLFVARDTFLPSLPPSPASPPLSPWRSQLGGLTECGASLGLGPRLGPSSEAYPFWRIQGAVADLPPAVLCLQTPLSFVCSFITQGLSTHCVPGPDWVPDQRGLVPAFPELTVQMRPPRVLCAVGEQGSWKEVAPTLGPEGRLEDSQQRATGRVSWPKGTAQAKA